MTANEVNAINLEKENNPEVLKNVIKYYQDRALELTLVLESNKETITQNNLEERFDIERIKAVLVKSGSFTF